MEKMVYIIYMDNLQHLLNIAPIPESEAKKSSVLYYNTPEAARNAMKEVYIDQPYSQ